MPNSLQPENAAFGREGSLLKDKSLQKGFIINIIILSDMQATSNANCADVCLTQANKNRDLYWQSIITTNRCVVIHFLGAYANTKELTNLERALQSQIFRWLPSRL